MDASDLSLAADRKWQVVIVNYRTPSLAVHAAICAREALGNRGIVTVVDSNSGDDSCNRLGEVEGIEVVSQQSNRGFGASLNAGARNHREPFLLCANADVTITASVLSVLEQRLAGNSALGIVGPRLLSPDGKAQPSCRRFPTHLNLIGSRIWPHLLKPAPIRWSYVLPEPPVFSLCDVVAGACMAIKRDLWDRLGGMDESFFLFAEDTDFCRRAKSAGWLVAYEPSVSVRHEWGASTGQNRTDSARKHAASLSVYLAKHYPGRRVANRLTSILMRLYVALMPSGPAGL